VAHRSHRGLRGLVGRFIDITAAETVLALHPRFKARALAYTSLGEHR
jgi:hypothetical protein